MDRFVLRTGHDVWREQRHGAGGPAGGSGRGGQRTLDSLAKVVVLPKGVTARVFSNDDLLAMKAVLDDPTSTAAQIIGSIRQLSSLVITAQHLADTLVGKTVRHLSKRSEDHRVRSLASSLLAAWRQAVEAERNGSNTAVGPCRTKDSQPSGSQRRQVVGPYGRPQSSRAAGGSGQPSQRLPVPSFWSSSQQQHHQQRGEETQTITSELRDRVKSNLSQSLCSASHEGAAEGSELPRLFPHLQQLGAAIEASIHTKLSRQPVQYRRKARELVANLRRNEVLRAKVMAGWVAADRLVQMSIEELSKRDSGDEI